MSNSTPSRPDPLVWGTGGKLLEIFMEPTCPFSGRAFGKLDELLARAGEGRLTIKLRLLSQPWHLLSPTVTRAVLAASTTSGGKSAAKAVLAAVFAHRDEFDLQDHCTGPHMVLSIRDVLMRLEQLSGVALLAEFQVPSLQAELKWHAKYARQNGIHVTPTFMVDGLVAPDFSSGDTVDVWLSKLGLA